MQSNHSESTIRRVRRRKEALHVHRSHWNLSLRCCKSSQWAILILFQLDFFSSSLKLFMLRSEVFDFFLAILAIPQMSMPRKVTDTLVPDPSKTPTVGECGEIQGTSMIQQKDDAWSFGTRDAVLQILGNLVYLNRSAQDQVGNDSSTEE